MIKKFEDLITEANSDLVRITLTKSEYKLLKDILKESRDTRSDMTCNDPYRNEERLFSKQERNKMAEYLSTKGVLSKEDLDDIEGFLFNDWYPAYLYHKIKDQVR